jgi:hypothetical protein
MDFGKIRDHIKNFKLDISRADNDVYFEVVIRKEVLAEVIGALEDFFGTAAWPSGSRLSVDAEKIIKNFGGIREGQTLFFADKGGVRMFAMLWPWQDGERITIKIGKI